ncbi:hypothetical protein ASPZODRAFT_135791 [Penicilliopsis zonata CBS 506.65]|uniref:Uncharacterized protein n=1 Tax=Penicilliopsis zonata CBS 506.65 TaxID=1073090 RepID=A0A1L9S9D8_9EURO|nr:hypothetical protein ASPZODRAFT_135791 [Penicilliopsis zonata CBS 506.65]OJJ43770.1 hypothetical protein ASPZODRAFT_135791 [Penicilliopsis zonata CBS 506.65]
MDGDNHRRRKHQYDRHGPPVSSSAAAAAAASTSGATDRLRAQSTRGGNHGASRRNPRVASSFAGYGYTDQASFADPSFQAGSLQPDGFQPFSPAQTPQRQRQRQHHFTYDPQAVYQLDHHQHHHQQGHAQQQGPYGLLPPYQERQSAAIDVMSSQFAVPQYFSPTTGVAAAAGVVPPYLPASTTTPYHQSQQQQQQQQQQQRQRNSISIGRASPATQPFPVPMADFTSVSSTGQPQHQQQQQQVPEPANLDEVFARFQRALQSTLDDTRAGRLIEASRSLLEISEWLVTNAQELGILRDDQLLHSDRLRLWNDFNICWLALGQRQKEMTQSLFETGCAPSAAGLLDSVSLENMGKDLIRLCDQLEQHGLVDYQMGVWEEEILCVLEQCLDLMETRPDLLRPQAVQGTVTTTAASRS